MIVPTKCRRLLILKSRCYRTSCCIPTVNVGEPLCGTMPKCQSTNPSGDLNRVFDWLANPATRDTTKIPLLTVPTPTFQTNPSIYIRKAYGHVEYGLCYSKKSHGVNLNTCTYAFATHLRRPRR